MVEVMVSSEKQDSCSSKAPRDNYIRAWNMLRHVTPSYGQVTVSVSDIGQVYTTLEGI